MKSKLIILLGGMGFTYLALGLLPPGLDSKPPGALVHPASSTFGGVYADLDLFASVCSLMMWGGAGLLLMAGVVFFLSRRPLPESPRVQPETLHQCRPTSRTETLITFDHLSLDPGGAEPIRRSTQAALIIDCDSVVLM